MGLRILRPLRSSRAGAETDRLRGICGDLSTATAAPRASGRPQEISRLPLVARDDQYWRERSSSFRSRVMSTGGPTTGGPERRHLHGLSISGQSQHARGGVSTRVPRSTRPWIEREPPLPFAPTSCRPAAHASGASSSIASRSVTTRRAPPMRRPRPSRRGHDSAMGDWPSSP